MNAASRKENPRLIGRRDSGQRGRLGELVVCKLYANKKPPTSFKVVSG